jgi:hypothetical protein
MDRHFRRGDDLCGFWGVAAGIAQPDIGAAVMGVGEASTRESEIAGQDHMTTGRGNYRSASPAPSTSITICR